MKSVVCDYELDTVPKNVMTSDAFTQAVMVQRNLQSFLQIIILTSFVNQGQIIYLRMGIGDAVVLVQKVIAQDERNKKNVKIKAGKELAEAFLDRIH